MISGTGRAGTSFLVRFLGACGLETAAGETDWHDRARAGGESILDPDADLPYVIKDPWLWTYCRTLDLDRVTIDALVVPVRDLTSAAASRVLQERAAMAETAWVDRDDVRVFGHVPGGIAYSLSIVDQERILAVGFHELLDWALSHEIPLVLLAFPRIVEDAEYLVSSLWPFLEGRIDRAGALAAFARLADAQAVRVRSQPSAPEAPAGSQADAELDRKALAIRIGELRSEVAGARDRLTALEGELAAAHARASSLQAELAQAQASLAAARHELATRLSTRIWRRVRRRRS